MALDSRKRIPFLDFARGIAICFIVFGHAIVYSEHCRPIYQFLYSFHVALFFLLSGYTFSTPGSISSFIKDKFARLMVPYLIWSFLFLIPYLLFGKGLDVKSAESSSFQFLEQIRNILYGNGDNNALKQNTSLWFLPALFSTEVLYGLGLKYCPKLKTNHGKIVSVFLLGVLGFLSTLLLRDFFLPWGMNTALQFGIFFYAGFLMKENDVLSHIPSDFRFLILYFIIGILCCFANNRNVSAADYRYGHYFLAIFSGFFLSLFVILGCKSAGSCRLLEKIGQNTMGILIFHKLIVILFQTKLGILSKVLKSSSFVSEMAVALLVSSLAIAVSLFLGLLIERTVPCIIGSRSRSK